MRTKFRLISIDTDYAFWTIEYKKWYQCEWHRIPFIFLESDIKSGHYDTLVNALNKSKL